MAEAVIVKSDLPQLANTIAEKAVRVESEIPTVLSTWEVQDLNRKQTGVQRNGRDAQTTLWSWTAEYRRKVFKQRYAKARPRVKKAKGSAPKQRRGAKRGERPVLRPHLHDILRQRVAEYIREFDPWR